MSRHLQGRRARRDRTAVRRSPTPPATAHVDATRPSSRRDDACRSEGPQSGATGSSNKRPRVGATSGQPRKPVVPPTVDPSPARSPPVSDGRRMACVPELEDDDEVPSPSPPSAVVTDEPTAPVAPATTAPTVPAAPLMAPAATCPAVVVAPATDWATLVTARVTVCTTLVTAPVTELIKPVVTSCAVPDSPSAPSAGAASAVASARVGRAIPADGNGAVTPGSRSVDVPEASEPAALGTSCHSAPPEAGNPLGVQLAHEAPSALMELDNPLTVVACTDRE